MLNRNPQTVRHKALADARQGFSGAGKPQVIFLIGPTAAGKSALALKLAQKIQAEIISLDSMQIYQGLDILSSKPSKKMQRAIPHHLLDIVAPDKEFDSAAYRRLAVRKIKEIQQRKKIPLFAGGTGLYLNLIIEGIFKNVKKDAGLRQKLYSRAKVKGSAYLYNKLKTIDPEAASKIHPNDLRRIVRGLEVYQLTGQPISELWKKRKGLSDKYAIRIFGLTREREKLYNDINLRVDKMFKDGLVKEVKKLLKGKLSLTALRAIGIREIQGYLNKEYDLEYARERLKKNTRNYAKRQLTWFRKDKRIIWMDRDKNNPLKEILARIKEETND